MSETVKTDGGPAFPGGSLKFDEGDCTTPYQIGMSLRDYFAIHADQPGAAEITQTAGFVLAAGQVWLDETTSLGTFNGWYDKLPLDERYRLYAKVRYALADAMLVARAEGKS